jgi:hypothetical protein
VATPAMGTAFKPIENSVRNETAAHRQNKTIRIPMLTSAEKPRWLHQVQVLASARHGDVKETAFSSISSGLPTAMSEGMQPSATLSMNTASHSWPLAEWIVDSTR